MRVGIILPSLDDSGAARAASNLSSLLSEHHEVHMITVYRHKPLQEWSGSFHILDVPPASPRDGVLRRMGLFIRRIIALRRLKAELELDVSVSFSEALSIQNIITSGSDRPVVSHHTVLSRNENLDDIYGKGLKVLVRLIYPQAAGIICVSRESASDLTDVYGIDPGRVSVIPNHIDVDAIEGAAVLPDKWEDVFTSPVILTAGRLTHAKGQWHLIRVFARLRELIPDIKLVILGDGDLKEYLHGLSEDLGLKTFTGGEPGEHDVYFAGFQKNPYGFMAHSELFVLPSLREALPLALMEAMALGVPVAAADCGGPREILAPNSDPSFKTDRAEFADYGILLPVFDGKKRTAQDKLCREEKLWVDALHGILTERELLGSYSERARKRALQFSRETIRERWLDFLDNVVGH